MLARSTLLRGGSFDSCAQYLADLPKTQSMSPSSGVRIADTVATHPMSSLGSTDPRTGLDVPMIVAQSSNAIVDVRNEYR
jgi:hypothetical protein